MLAPQVKKRGLDVLKRPDAAVTKPLGTDLN